MTGSLIYMFTTCFAKFCHLCVTLYCRPARLCVSYLRNNLVVCSTREEVCSCVRAEKEFVVLELEAVGLVLAAVLAPGPELV